MRGVILDNIFMILTLLALCWVCLSFFSKKSKMGYTASHVWVALVIAVQVFVIMLYGGLTGHAAVYKVASFIGITAMLCMATPIGGGVWKIIIMVLYFISAIVDYVSETLYFGIMRPYLDIVVSISYIQLMVLLFSPKIEVTNLYGRISQYIIERRILGVTVRRYVCYHFNGMETLYQRKEKK